MKRMTDHGVFKGATINSNEKHAPLSTGASRVKVFDLLSEGKRFPS